MAAKRVRQAQQRVRAYTWLLPTRPPLLPLAEIQKDVVAYSEGANFASSANVRKAPLVASPPEERDCAHHADAHASNHPHSHSADGSYDWHSATTAVGTRTYFFFVLGARHTLYYI